jgi:hypothetical protein
MCTVVGGLSFDYIYHGKMHDLPPKLAEQIIKTEPAR